MATHAPPGTSAPARDLSPYPTDYRTWKILAWTGPVFLFAFFCLWGIVGRQHSAVPGQRDAGRGHGSTTRTSGLPI